MLGFLRCERHRGKDNNPQVQILRLAMLHHELVPDLARCLQPAGWRNFEGSVLDSLQSFNTSCGLGREEAPKDSVRDVSVPSLL